MRLIYKHTSHSSQPPSSSVQTHPLYTAPEDTHQISLDDQDITGPHLSAPPSCSPQTDGGFCVLCLDPVCSDRSLREERTGQTCVLICVRGVRCVCVCVCVCV